MTWMTLDTWIVVTGALCAIACALPGSFLVLRKMSMMGDAISHAVLPGLAGGFLMMLIAKDSTLIDNWLPGLATWLDSADPRHPLVMLGGAIIVGAFTTVMTQWISTFGRVDRGASMGIVFTTLFAIGLILIVRAASDHRVDLDPGCVLYGAIELTPIDTWSIPKSAGVFSIGNWTITAWSDGFDVPRAAVILGFVAMANLTLIVLLFKELRISAFDPELATTVGINATLMHYILMAMVAVTTVASFEAVGSIIVIAMLIVPAATAYLLTDRLALMLLLSSVIGVLAAGLGHVGALVVPGWFGFEETSTSGMMATAAGLLFALAWLFAPRYGVVTRRLLGLKRHSADEDEPPRPKPSDRMQDASF